MSAARQLCTFVVGTQRLGVDVGWVREVVPALDVTPIPLAPPEVVGLANLRGDLVTVIDAHTRLGSRRPDTGGQAMDVVLITHNEIVAIRVDAVGDVVTVAGIDLDPCPDTVDEAYRDLIGGEYQLDDGLLLVIDPERLLDLGHKPAHEPEEAIHQAS